jgi:hypothetical protein
LEVGGVPFLAFAIPAVLIVALASLVLLITSDWRINILALSLQYVGVFFLVGISWPLGMAAVKLIAGWMSGAVLGMAVISIPGRNLRSRNEGPAADVLEPQAEITTPGGYLPASPIFRLLTAVLVGLAVLSLAPELARLAPGIEIEQATGGLILIGMGLLQLGLTAQPLRTILGLLTVLSGFEILYAAVEDSTLVAGLLAAVNLGLALIGAYLLLTPEMETE